MSDRNLFASARTAGRDSLGEAEGKTLLAQFGIAVPRSVVVEHSKDAEAALAGLVPPFAVKVVSPDILHKSDAGGVRLRLDGARAVAAAIEDMAARPAIAAARVEGYLVEEMAPAGREVVIGGLTDPQFGPMIMVGLGGIFVEVLKDVAFRLCPITSDDAHAIFTMTLVN